MDAGSSAVAILAPKRAVKIGKLFTCTRYKIANERSKWSIFGPKIDHFGAIK